jgi:hypothetical protein
MMKMRKVLMKASTKLVTWKTVKMVLLESKLREAEMAKKVVKRILNLKIQENQNKLKDQTLKSSLKS